MISSLSEGMINDFKHSKWNSTTTTTTTTNCPMPLLRIWNTSLVKLGSSVCPYRNQWRHNHMATPKNKKVDGNEEWQIACLSSKLSNSFLQVTTFGSEICHCNSRKFLTKSSHCKNELGDYRCRGDDLLSVYKLLLFKLFFISWFEKQNKTKQQQQWLSGVAFELILFLPGGKTDNQTKNDSLNFEQAY